MRQKIEFRRAAQEIEDGCIEIYLSIHRLDLGMEALHALLCSQTSTRWRRVVIVNVLRNGTLPASAFAQPVSSAADEGRIQLRLKLSATDPSIKPLYRLLANLPTRDQRNYAVHKLLARAAESLNYVDEFAPLYVDFYNEVSAGNAVATPTASPAPNIVSPAPLPAQQIEVADRQPIKPPRFAGAASNLY